MGTAAIQEKLTQKKARLQAYLARETYLLSPDAVQSYGVGTRNVQRYNTDLGQIQSAIAALETEIKELEALQVGAPPRRAFGVVPRDW